MRAHGGLLKRHDDLLKQHDDLLKRGDERCMLGFSNMVGGNRRRANDTYP